VSRRYLCVKKIIYCINRVSLRKSCCYTIQIDELKSQSEPFIEATIETPYYLPKSKLNYLSYKFI
ncbi:MAG: hypothetical protein O4965_27310, partial [Trichodesmium sp. St19_bin1]|nr:hypothetical protein [Trichodesmium sp. St19_bin1]